MTSKARTGGDPLQMVSALIEAGHLDTVYRDVYLDRARVLLGEVLSFDTFQRFEQQKAELARIPVVIGRAMDKANWPEVKELSERARALRQAVEGKQGAIETARAVYAVSDVRLDPFSPGLGPFVALPTRDLSALRTRAVERMTVLEQMDAPLRDFYAGRRAALQALVLATPEQSGATGAAGSPGDAREAAAEALKRGDMIGLAKLADTLIAAAGALTGRPASRGPAETAASPPEAPAPDLLVSYSADTLTRARRLGLAPRRAQSRAEMASLRQYAWNPLFADESGRISVKQVPLPAGTPEAFRERLEMLVIHPLVNSGGARHLPRLVAEDVLIEDFPDPTESDEPPVSGLLAALGLPARRGLKRMAIEQALSAHGGRVVGELALDPLAFRLVCIPPDIHLRLGEAEAWGRQPLWTHFDGYLIMADGRLLALAGGDVRFGGLYDLLGISRDYDSDRVVARFAVVRRERMVAW